MNFGDQACVTEGSIIQRKYLSVTRKTSSLYTMSVIMRMVCLLTRFGCATESHPTRFDFERSTHELGTLKSNNFRYVSNLIDNSTFFHDLVHIMKPRTPGSRGHKEVGQFIIKNMESLNWSVETDSFIANTPIGVIGMRNIIATLDPEAPRRLVIACHYDSKLMREEFFAATDSAVPCNIMLHIAKNLNDALQKHKKAKNRYTLQLVFLDGEEAFITWNAEDSLYGSRHLAEKWAKTKYNEHPHQDDHSTTELDRIDIFMLLDLLGTKDPHLRNFFTETSQYHVALNNIEKRLHNERLLENHIQYYFDTSRHYGSGIEDDHKPFEKRGVPILHVIPVPFPSVWHTVKDDMSALHHPTIRNLVKIFTVFISEYLNLDSYIEHE